MTTPWKLQANPRNRLAFLSLSLSLGRSLSLSLSLFHATAWLFKAESTRTILTLCWMSRGFRLTLQITHCGITFIYIYLSFGCNAFRYLESITVYSLLKYTKENVTVRIIQNVILCYDRWDNCYDPRKYHGLALMSWEFLAESRRNVILYHRL